MGRVAMNDQNPFGAATPDDIEVAGRRLGMPVPPEYAEFLLWSNGGRPVANVCPAVGTDVYWIYGVNEAPPWSSLWSTLAAFAGRIPNGVIPVASDSAGNLFLLGVLGDDAGSVWFWDHEAEFDRAKGGGDVPLPVVATTFGQFLADLVPA